MHRNYEACARESQCSAAREATTTTKPVHISSRASAQQQEKPPQWEAVALEQENTPHSSQLEKPMCSNEDPAQPKKPQFMNLSYECLK